MSPLRIVTLSILAVALWLPANAPAHTLPLSTPCAGAHDPLPGAISTSANVEHLGWMPGEAGNMASGGRKVGDWFYLSGVAHISIYDVSEPERPKLASRIELPCRFENEDVEVTPDGAYLIYSDFATTGALYVYDVRDKTRPRLAAEVPDAGTHTMSCALDCSLLVGSYLRLGAAGPLTTGLMIDLSDPQRPVVLGDWTDRGVLPSRKVHDATEVAPGLVATASAPIQIMDVTDDPLRPRVLAAGPDPAKRYHSVAWPRQGRDKFLLAAYETNATTRCETGAGDFSVFDVSAVRDGASSFPRVSSFYLTNGSFSDGNPMANVGLGCSPHWFEVRPSWKNGGIVAMGAYDHGVKFLRVSGGGAITEAGHFLAPGSNASAAYWITCDIVYSVDYTRGLDVLRFTDEASACRDDDPAADDQR